MTLEQPSGDSAVMSRMVHLTSSFRLHLAKLFVETFLHRLLAQACLKEVFGLLEL